MPRGKASRTSKCEDTVMDIYNCLIDHFGPQGWWPGESRFETIVGAILTQAVAWRNVEKAICALKKAGLFSEDAIISASEEVSHAIKPALYYRQKVRKLSVMIEFIQKQYGGDYDLMFTEPIEILRPRLLALWGIGPETADSILLYAGNYPVFVVDAYTRRIFARLGLVGDDIAYRDMQNYLHEHTTADAVLYNEYHALLVAVGSHCCMKNNPHCAGCPLAFYCRR